MKKLTHYILSLSLINWILVLLGLMAAMVLGDFVANLKHFSKLEGSLFLEGVSSHFAQQIPSWLPLIIPISALMSGFLSVTRLQKSHEWLAISSGGLSIRRFLLMMALSVGGLCSALHWADLEFGIPALDPEALSLKEKVRGADHDRFALVQAVPDNTPIVASWYPAKQQLEDIVLVDTSGLIFAEAGTWKGDHWLLNNVDFHRHRDTVKPFEQQRLDSWRWQTSHGPRELTELNLDNERLTHRQLIDKIKRYPREKRVTMAAAARWSQPAMSLGLLLALLPLALTGRSALGSAGRAAILTLAYMILSNVCFELGTEGWMPILIAAWLPFTLAVAIGINSWRQLPT